MKNEKNVSGKNIKGFTLIEVLVVVLIIGILAAIAVPQYKLAVAKVRISALIPVLRSIQQAQERYYMANGEFAADIHNLDVTCAAFGTGAHENWCYLDKKGTSRAHLGLSDTTPYKRGHIVGQDNRVEGVHLYYFFYNNTSSASCYALDGNNEEFNNRVCQSLSGLSEPSSRIIGANVYKLW